MRSRASEDQISKGLKGHSNEAGFYSECDRGAMKFYDKWPEVI
jgi:hypothetical protein